MPGISTGSSWSRAARARVPACTERLLRQLERAAKVALLGLDLGPFAQHGLELTATTLRPGKPGGLIEDR